jgi:hypothetical protein
MAITSCYPLKEGEILNEAYPDYPLFFVTIHGSERERIKLSKRLVCALKHLPLRLQIHYEKDTETSLNRGVRHDPTLEYEDTFLAEGLVSAETLNELFSQMLQKKES